MAGTLEGIYDNLRFALQQHTEALAELQEQASTGSKVRRASDGPVAAYEILGLGSQVSSLQTYMDNSAEVISTLEISSGIISKMSSNLSTAEERMTQVVSGTYTDAHRRTAAGEIDEILEQVVLLANWQYSGRSLFGGTKTSTLPYKVQRTNGQISSVTYQGSLDGRDIEVAAGVEMPAFLVGDALFRSDDRSTPVFPESGGTGAKAGTGTSTVRGDVWLEVIYEDSNYKMRIDGGAYVTVDGTGNQAVTDLDGRILYVDSSAIDSTGKDLVRVPGTYDIFETLINMRDVLQDGDAEQLSQLQDKAAYAFDELKKLLARASVFAGTRMGSLGQLKDTVENLKYSAAEEAGRLQSADIAEVAMEMAQRQILYEMSLAVTAKLLSISLLDFIR